MKLLPLLIVLTLSNNTFANQIVYYDIDKNSQVIDVSGKKDFKDIKQEFNLPDNVQILNVSEGEGYEVKNNQLVKYNLKNRQKDLEAIAKQKQIEKQQKKEQLISKVKNKLNLTDNEWEDLRGALFE